MTKPRPPLELDAQRLIDQLVARGVDLEAPWPSVMRLAPPRPIMVLPAMGIGTLRALIHALGNGGTRGAGLMPSELGALLAHVTTIAEHGPTYYLHGGHYDPSTGAGLTEALAHTLDARLLMILNERGRGRSLEALGAELHVTRERVRQLEVKARKIAQQRFGESITELGATLRAHLHAYGTLIPIAEVQQIVQASTLDEARRVSSLVAPELTYWRGAWLTQLPHRGLEAAAAKAHRRLQRANGMDTKGAQRLLQALGLPLSRIDTRTFTEEVLRVVWSDAGRVIARAPRLRDRVIDVMREARGVLSLDTIVERVRALVAADERSEPFRYRTVQRMVNTDPRVVCLGVSRFVLREHAPIKLATLARAVARTIAVLRECGSLNLATFTKQLRASERGCRDLHWRTLRSELSKVPDVLTWRGSMTVGWRPSHGQGLASPKATLVALLRASPKPVSVRSLARRVDRTPELVSMTLVQLREVLRLGDGWYAHRDLVPVDDAVVYACAAQVAESLPIDGTPRTSRVLLAELAPRLDPSLGAVLSGPYGPRLLFGLVHWGRSGLDLRFGRGGLIARDAGRPAALTERLMLALLRERTYRTTRGLHRALSKAGYKLSYGSFRRLVWTLRQRGLVLESADGWSAPDRSPPTDLSARGAGRRRTGSPSGRRADP